ncbi:STAS/SEC14 domain-containing protein [Asticcacaulis excentricus]|uniref:STAS/SEC14 domain-containing protein n=1 Tax=Asticcacaulis excentricus (strain ATCC 15261 / DSM 4724 / KCTC 12464 / NCIMB 9791 / VKM B-1370 / CB 48) TaxID=573065 RepID=E8RSD7_ASTEC|nr:STAS/SEC14 domain-containing protein [Asticcacaulis excentricus]ADU14408.1 hypothetical protein Astex_2769 [Asticcacaulis excentricus CB 48]
MPRPLRLSHLIDTDKNLLIVTARGDYTSEGFVDALIDIYQRIDQPWLYNRILDMRSAQGVVELADLMRAAAWLAQAAGTPPPPRRRLALLSSDPFDRARLNALGDAFPKAFIQLFERRDEAIEWLTTPQP